MIRYNKRTAYLLMYLGFFVCSLYYYIPGIIFYYDQETGKGEITKIIGKRAYVDYFHKDSGKEVSVFFREGNRLNLEKLDIGKEIQLKYSKKFPSEIAIINYHSSPGLGGLVMVILFFSPLLLFRWIKF